MQNRATQNLPQKISYLPTFRKTLGILEYWNKYIYSSLTTIYMLYIGLVFSPFQFPLVLFLTNKNSSPIPISLNLFQFHSSNSNSKPIRTNYAYFSILSKFIIQPTLNACIKKLYEVLVLSAYCVIIETGRGTSCDHACLPFHGDMKLTSTNWRLQ